ncbi:hypothetical protein AGMMS49938_01580 [Fibrobacterales bacterium]|nr:hypothetical protein AGMMS49938_01580 [Fibrobacterales bacterium]
MGGGGGGVGGGGGGGGGVGGGGGGGILFGELTFYPESGLGKFNPTETDQLFGEWLKLPKEGK